jgi:hypothetical protein
VAKPGKRIKEYFKIPAAVFKNSMRLIEFD